MARKFKRVLITLCPEWGPMLDQLKKDKFYNNTQAEMFRYLIQQGLESLKENGENTRMAG